MINIISINFKLLSCWKLKAIGGLRDIEWYNSHANYRGNLNIVLTFEMPARRHTACRCQNCICFPKERNAAWMWQSLSVYHQTRNTVTTRPNLFVWFVLRMMWVNFKGLKCIGSYVGASSTVYFICVTLRLLLTWAGCIARQNIGSFLHNAYLNYYHLCLLMFFYAWNDSDEVHCFSRRHPIMCH